jgi:hypothetical protein
MSRSRIVRRTCAVGALILTLAVSSTASAQLGHRVSRDWTIGVEARRSANDGYNSDFRRIGLTEYEGDVTGTYISWGFGGIKTEWSAPAIVIVGAVPFVLCLVIGALACASSIRRRRGNGASTDD